MGIRSKTIFSSSSLPTTEGIETKKTSYWLEKLFKQERELGERRFIHKSMLRTLYLQITKLYKPQKKKEQQKL